MLTKRIKDQKNVVLKIAAVLVIAFISFQFTQSNPAAIKLKKGAHIILVGNNLGSRMMNFGHFETEMQVRYPDSFLYIRNMCDGGNTPGFRP
ncbi:MAG: dehydrogenase, partial [Segetibacter sp.]|nr:dehydrogenase [Segetibacter sp.]